MTYLEPIPTKTHAFDDQERFEKDHRGDVASEHTFVLSQREAEAASPESFAVCGEEDPGEGLEFLVADEENESNK